MRTRQQAHLFTLGLFLIGIGICFWCGSCASLRPVNAALFPLTTLEGL